MNVPKLRFKADDGSEFPEWEEKRLGDVGTVAMCKRVFKEQTSENGEVPFFKIGTFGDKPDAYISYKLFDELRTKYPYPKKGTVLLSASGTVGRQVIYNGEDAYYQDSNIVWLEHDDTIMDGFLKQFYSIVKWKGLEGSTIKRLYNKTILDTIFYLPSLPEQSKIASFLYTIDEIIQSTESELTAWQERKKGVMQKIFNREVRFKADDGSEFPEWEEKRLGDVFVERSERSADNLDLLSVTIANGVIRQNESDKRNVSSVDKSNYKRVYIGDLAYNSMRMWQGAEGVSAYDGIVSPAYTVLVPKKQEYVYFYEYMFKRTEMLHIFQRYSQGLTSDTWNLKYPALSHISVVVPSLLEQKKIAECLSSVDGVIRNIQAELSTWKEFKKGLLRQMFV